MTEFYPLDIGNSTHSSTQVEDRRHAFVDMSEGRNAWGNNTSNREIRQLDYQNVNDWQRDDGNDSEDEKGEEENWSCTNNCTENFDDQQEDYDEDDSDEFEECDYYGWNED